MHIARRFSDSGGLPPRRNVAWTSGSKLELNTNQDYPENDQCDALRFAELHGSP